MISPVPPPPTLRHRWLRCAPSKTNFTFDRLVELAGVTMAGIHSMDDQAGREAVADWRDCLDAGRAPVGRKCFQRLLQAVVRQSCSDRDDRCAGHVLFATAVYAGELRASCVEHTNVVPSNDLHPQ